MKGSGSWNHTDIRSLDEALAKYAILVFLCKINADSRDLERFLLRYPESLLFEGAEVDGGARQVIVKQMERCQCFTPSCNSNRQRSLELIGRGFDYYRARTISSPWVVDLFLNHLRDGKQWSFYLKQIHVLQRDIREIRQKEASVHQAILEARAHVETYRTDLEIDARNEKHRSPLALLKCQRPTNAYRRRAQLENKLGSETLNVLKLEDEANVLDEELRASRQLQKSLLKMSLAGCGRHMCNASRDDLEE